MITAMTDGGDNLLALLQGGRLDEDRDVDVDGPEVLVGAIEDLDGLLNQQAISNYDSVKLMPPTWSKTMTEPLRSLTNSFASMLRPSKPGLLWLRSIRTSERLIRPSSLSYSLVVCKRRRSVFGLRPLDLL